MGDRSVRLAIFCYDTPQSRVVDAGLCHGTIVLFGA